MKKLLFITDPIHNFKATDTTCLMFLTAKNLGYKVFYCLVNDIYSKNDQAWCNVKELNFSVTLTDNIADHPSWFCETEYSNNHLLNEFSAVLVRNDPPFDMEYYYLTQLLSIAEKHGAKVINNSFALRNFNEKLTILQFPELITPTIVTKNKHIILDFLNEHEVCVIKPLDLMAGRSVFRISLTDVNHMVIIENITENFKQTIMIQKFIPEVVKGDKRIFIIHGQVVPHCLYRIPAPSQIRGNLAVGGRGEVHELNNKDLEIANIIAKWAVKQGISFVGIDVIGDKLTEINITSPTGARQILASTGLNIIELLFKQL